MNKKVAILTPTYNREKTLGNLYNSLLRQSSKNFTWYVVDDGSEDNTRTLIEGLIAEGKLPIVYLYKENGGKHTALNMGVKHIREELTLIVDSDDYLTDDAIQIIENTWNNYCDKDICGISFLKGYDNQTCVGDLYLEECICSYITMRLKNNIKGDKAEVYRTDLLQKIPFPEIENERFLGEDYVWVKLAKERPMVWANKIIYICEYLDGGLSKSGRKLRINCPVGGMLNSAVFLSKEIPFKWQVKKAILYNCYYFFALKQNKKKQLALYPANKSLLRFLTLPLGWSLYIYWRNKYT